MAQLTVKRMLKQKSGNVVSITVSLADQPSTWGDELKIKRRKERREKGEESEEAARVVTIAHRNGETMKIRAQEMTGSPVASRSTVLVRKSHDGRMLEAVYVRQLNVLLYLDGDATIQSGPMERLPIS